MPEEVKTFSLIESIHCSKYEVSKFRCRKLSPREENLNDKKTTRFRILPKFTRRSILEELTLVFGITGPDSVVYIDNVPLRRPFGEYDQMLIDSIAKTLTTLTQVIRDLIANYLVVDIVQADDTFSIEDFANTITISVAPTSTALFADSSELSPITVRLLDSHTGNKRISTITTHYVDEKYLTVSYNNGLSRKNHLCATRSLTPVSPEVTFVRNRRLYATPLTLTLTIGENSVVFMDAGVVGVLLDAAPSMSQLFNQAIGCFAAYLEDHNLTVGSDDIPRDFVIDDINPVLWTAGKFQQIGGLNATLHNTATLELSGVMPTVNVTVPIPPFDLETMVHHLFAESIARELVFGYKPQQAALSALNNYWLLLSESTDIFHTVQQAMQLQLQESTESFPCFDFRKMDLQIGKGIVSIPYIEQLMQLPWVDAAHVMGHVEVVWGDFFDPSACVSGSSMFPCLVTPRGKDPVVILKPDACFTRDFPVDENTFESKEAICRRLRLPLEVEFNMIPFRCDYNVEMCALPRGFSRVEATPFRASFPIASISDLTEAFLWSLLVDCFHFNMNAALNVLIARNKKPDSFRPPELFNNFKNRFSVVFQPDLVESLLEESNCSRRPKKRFGDFPRVDMEQICGPATEESALKDLVTRLPDCVHVSLDIFPLNVPHGTPVIILHLALRYCMMKCGCFRCSSMMDVFMDSPGNNAPVWCVGAGIGAVPKLGRMVIGHKFMGDRSPPALANANDIRMLFPVKWLMQFFSTKAADYLLNTLSLETPNDGNAYPLFQDIFDMNAVLCRDSPSPELQDNELRLSFWDTNIRFFWDAKINHGKRRRSLC